MNQIDFFGCSFTESPNFSEYPKTKEFNILKYSMHCQTTKTISNFLEYDLEYNLIDDFKINNFAGGSFGNHVIKEIIKNRIKELDKTHNNIAIVQLSALLRNEKSFEQLFNSEFSSLLKHKDGVFNIEKENVRNDYFMEYSNLESFYLAHIKNLEEIITLLENNYSDFYIHLGWDFFTQQFSNFFSKSEKLKIINKWEYHYKLNEVCYFENLTNYSSVIKNIKGKNGGMLDYAANKLDESIRYVHIKDDHHPSYFSNKIFYLDIIKPFFQKYFDLSKNYFELNSVMEFEKYLKELLPTKENTDGKVYMEMQVKIVNYIRSNILNHNI